MKIIASILIFGLSVAGAFAESDEVDAQYFHPAAGLYIHGDAAAASNLVVKGLSLYPDDGKLKRLKELLENQQKQQQDQENQEQQQNDQEQDPQQDDQQQENEQNQETQNQEEGQEQEPRPEPQDAEQMSEDEAKQLLDAMRQEEKNKRLQLHPVMGAPVNVDKDW